MVWVTVHDVSGQKASRLAQHPPRMRITFSGMNALRACDVRLCCSKPVECPDLVTLPACLLVQRMCWCGQQCPGQHIL